MRKTLAEVQFEIGTVEALMHAFEQSYLDGLAGSDEVASRGAYVFYAMWDAVKRADVLLQKMEEDCAVIDVIDVAKSRQCASCNLKK